MKLADFMEKYNGDIAVYNRQFASADDSVENLLDNDDTDLNPKSVANNNNKSNKNNNNDDVGKTDQELVPQPSTSSSSLSPNRKRHSDEENQESLDSLGPLPKTAASSRTLAPKFETPAAASSSTSKMVAAAFETPAGAAGRAPLTACTPANARAPRRSELENPNLASKLVLFQESKTGSPLAQDLSEMGTPELKKIQAQIDRMMKMKTKN